MKKNQSLESLSERLFARREDRRERANGKKSLKTRALRLEGLEERQLLDASPIAAAMASEHDATAILVDFDAILVDFDQDAIPIELESAAPKTWIVTSTENAATVEGSLRHALTQASSGDTITFAPELKGATITLKSQLSITKSVTIDASSIWDAENDAPGITISGGGKVRAIRVSGAATNAEIIGVTIADGYANGSTDELRQGGGIYVKSGALTLTNSVVEGGAVGVNYEDGGLNEYYYSLSETMRDAAQAGFVGMTADGTNADIFSDFAVTTESFRTTYLGSPSNVADQYGYDLDRRESKRNVRRRGARYVKQRRFELRIG